MTSLTIEKIGDSKMNTVLIGVILFLSGGAVTGGSIWAIQSRNQQQSAEYVNLISEIGKIKSEVAEAQLVTTVNLTNTDLLKVPCSAEYIKEHKSDLLCREMFCRLQSRGLDEGASAVECEEISNLANSLIILDSCKDLEEGAYRACLSVFTSRK